MTYVFTTIILLLMSSTKGDILILYVICDDLRITQNHSVLFLR